MDKYVPEAYNLVRKLPVNDACNYGFVDYCFPRNNVDTGNVEFVVEGNNEHCIVPNKIFVKVEFEITGLAARKAAATDTTTTLIEIGTGDNMAKIVPVNNILHSAFESVDVYVNNMVTTRADRNYGYNAYFDIIRKYGEQSLDTYFQLGGWYKDDLSHMDSYSIKESTNLQARRNFWSLSNKALKGQFIGRLCSPLFMQEKILPPQVGLRVIMKKANNAFCLMHEGGDFQLKISGIVLMVQKVTPALGIKESYIKLLDEGNPLQYFLRTPMINYYTIPVNTSQFVRDDLFLGKMPKHIIIGMVETTAYHGDSKKNPFNFQHFNINEIGLYKDGMPYPCPVTKMDFTNNMYAEVYHNFMKSLGSAYANNVPTINKDEFKSGFTLFSYDMSPDQSGSVQAASMLNMNSNIRLELKFNTVLPSNVTLLVYAEFENVMEISKDRNVTVDF